MGLVNRRRRRPARPAPRRRQLAAEIAAFPQTCLRNDRLSAAGAGRAAGGGGDEERAAPRAGLPTRRGRRRRPVRGGRGPPRAPPTDPGPSGRSAAGRTSVLHCGRCCPAGRIGACIHSTYISANNGSGRRWGRSVSCPATQGRTSDNRYNHTCRSAADDAPWPCRSRVGGGGQRALRRSGPCVGGSDRPGPGPAHPARADRAVSGRNGAVASRRPVPAGSRDRAGALPRADGQRLVSRPGRGRGIRGRPVDARRRAARPAGVRRVPADVAPAPITAGHEGAPVCRAGRGCRCWCSRTARTATVPTPPSWSRNSPATATWWSRWTTPYDAFSRVPRRPGRRPARMSIRPACRPTPGDIRFVLDRIEDLAAGRNPDVEPSAVPAGLGGALDLRRIGMFGWSKGGTATALVMVTDRRVRAGLSLDGPMQSRRWPTPTSTGRSC